MGVGWMGNSTSIQNLVCDLGMVQAFTGWKKRKRRGEGFHKGVNDLIPTPQHLLNCSPAFGLHTVDVFRDMCGTMRTTGSSTERDGAYCMLTSVCGLIFSLAGLN